MSTLLAELDHYDRGAIKMAIQNLVDELGGWEHFLADRQHLLLKPNFVVPEKAQGGATTHPDFYMAVAELIQATGRRVTIGESPAFGSAETGVRLHGVTDECKDRNIDVITFKAAKPIAGVPEEKSYAKLSIARELDDFDGLIDLPKLKVHDQLTFTGATKNLFGCVSGKRKFYRHNVCKNDPVRFSRMLLKNAAEASPVLCIGDGIQSMHGKGPRGGAMYPLNRIFENPRKHQSLRCSWI